MSKLIAYLASILLVYCACACIQTLASSPQADKKTEPDINQQNQQDLIGRYYCQILKQFGGLDKTALPGNNLINSQGKIDEKHVSKVIDSFPIKNEQINKSVEFIKGLVYDPLKPDPFFNNLIAVQQMSVAAQNQLITLAETSLGPKNSYVVSLKENYNYTLKYIEALKHQKALLDQAPQATH
jgi:hypothetical protein